MYQGLSFCLSKGAGGGKGGSFADTWALWGVEIGVRARCMSPSVKFASSAMSTSQYHATTAPPQHAHLGPMAPP